jgi:RimJ/RimL family protein N-acetyltransferase
MLKEGNNSVPPKEHSIPTRAGRWTALVPIEPPLLDFLYSLAVDPASGYRWRFAGTVPSRSQFEASLWPGVLSQFVVIGRPTGTPIGHVVAYDADLRNRHVKFGQIMTIDRQATGQGIEAGLLFCDYLFKTWDFRKLYFEVPEYNLEWIVNKVGPLFKEEGRLKQHLYFSRRNWDSVILALYPNDFYAILSSMPSVRSQRLVGDMHDE